MFVFCIRENGSEWKSSLVTPGKSHHHTQTYTNHQNLATFSQPASQRWCWRNLEIAQIIVLTCPACAHLQTRIIWRLANVKIVMFFVRSFVLHYCFCSYVLPPTKILKNGTVARVIFRSRFVSVVFVHFSLSRSLFVVSIGHEIRKCWKQRDSFKKSNLHGYKLLINLSESSFYQTDA